MVDFVMRSGIAYYKQSPQSGETKPVNSTPQHSQLVFTMPENNTQPVEEEEESAPVEEESAPVEEESAPVEEEESAPVEEEESDEESQ